MTNDSSTGGVLLPDGTVAPLEGQALSRYIQQWVVGLTGLPGKFVSARWQAEPANIPDAGEAWAAIGITSRPSDNFPAVTHDGTGEGSDVMLRYETLMLLCSFYDLGSNGLADQYCALLRDGAVVAQNREYLQNEGFDLLNTDEPLAVPTLVKTRWLYRVDMVVNLRRTVKRRYPVRNLIGADITIVNDEGFTVHIEPVVQEN